LWYALWILNKWILKKIKNVEFASVNLATESAFLISEKEISLENVKKAVEESG